MPRDYYAEEIEGKPKRDYYAEEIEGRKRTIAPPKPKPTIYSEVVAPILEGGSTFAAGIPRLVAKMQGKGMEEATFPEQQTIPGKLIRGASEVAGFTAGLPGQVGKRAGMMAGKAIAKVAPRSTGKILARMLQGAVAGGAGMATAGSDLEDRAEKVKLGTVIGAGTSAIAPVVNLGFKNLSKLLSTASGADKEIWEEVSKKGFRNVLQEKFYSRKLPAEIQQRIADNIDNMAIEAGKEFDNLTEPLRKVPFDLAQLRGDVVKLANKIKKSPFKSEGMSKLDNDILNGIVNKAKVGNLKDALDLRRALDDEIYDANGELTSKFGKNVRDLLNKELHQHTELKAVDQEWTNLMDLLKQGKKILGENGEKILARFGSMTMKQKAMLSNLERKIGVPFVEDLTNYNLSKDFVTHKVSPSISGVLRAVIRPVTRSVLRKGEGFNELVGNIDTKNIKNLIGEK